MYKSRFTYFGQTGLILIVGISLAASITQQSIGQKIFEGEEAAVVNLNKLLDYQKETITLTNKNILIDFWFTGCKPCIESVPKLNKIVETYPEDQIIVVSVNSIDNVDLINKFVKKYDLKTHIVSDSGKQMSKAFDITALPTVVLIDKNNRVRWKGHIDQVDSAFLQSFLKEDVIIKDPVADKVIYSVDLRHAADRTISSVTFESGEKYGYTWKNRSARNILEELVNYLSSFENNTTKYFIEGEGPSTYFDFSFRVDSSMNHRDIHVDFIERLSSIFGYSIVERRQEVFRLEIVDRKKLQRAISPDQDQPPSVSFEEKSFAKVTNLKMAVLIEVLIQSSSCVIETQETNSHGYDFNIPATKDFSELSNFLKQHGIQLSKTGKTINTVHLIFTN